METSIIKQIKEKQALLIDVRTNGEWEAAHADAAMHFDLARIINGELPPVPKDIPVYLYCRSGQRSDLAANILRKNGFNAINLGGLSDWEAMGGQIKDGQQDAP